MKNPSLPVCCGWLLAACLLSGPASASVVIATTRVIYPAQDAEVTVSLSNQGQHPSLVQVWIDDERPDAPLEQLQVPFSLTPALFRLDPGKGQMLRLFQGQHAFAQDRESLFWLNVLDIPPKGEGNALQLSVRSRIKLLYRPQGLEGDAQQAPQALTWRLRRHAHDWTLEADNPSRYHVNLSELSLHVGARVYPVTSDTIEPLSTRAFALAPLDQVNPSSVRVHFASVNDYGAVIPAQQLVQVVRKH